MLGSAPRVGPFSLLVARPYSFLDVGLDFQANIRHKLHHKFVKPSMNRIILNDNEIPLRKKCVTTFWYDPLTTPLWRLCLCSPVWLTRALGLGCVFRGTPACPGAPEACTRYQTDARHPAPGKTQPTYPLSLLQYIPGLFVCIILTHHPNIFWRCLPIKSCFILRIVFF